MATERYHRLLDWMGEHNITFAALGQQIGKGPASARYAVFNDTVAPEIHKMLLKLGFPEELLPIPSRKRKGPTPRQPHFPGLAQA